MPFLTLSYWEQIIRRAIEDAIERLGVLIALRKAPETIPPGKDLEQGLDGPIDTYMPEKRNKRPRAPSPSATPVPVAPPAVPNRSVSITLPARNSVGPSSNLPFSRDPKTRREALAKQLPLQKGRKVAFHPPAGKPTGGSTADTDENTWILAVVTKSINADKTRSVFLSILTCLSVVA